MKKRTTNRLGVALTAVALGFGLMLSQHSFAKNAKAPSNGLAELERLDSAANLLMFVSDSKRPAQCKIKPVEAKRLLLALHPLLDEARRKVEKTPIDLKWEKTCSKGCHCGLYASILEDRGDEGLSDQQREMKLRLYKKAQMVSSKEIQACASRDASWFCKSDLLKKLRQEAKDYPDPALKPDKKKGMLAHPLESSSAQAK